MTTRFRSALAMLAGVGMCVVGVSSEPVRAADETGGGASPGWDRQAAARYLDSREAWWQAWDRTQKDRGTTCVSCHTQAPYGMARPSLGRDLGEQTPNAAGQRMLASVVKRVRQWNQMQPFYSDVISGPGKEIESRDAESVLNAVILTGHDVPQGHLAEITRLAYDNAWALQSKSGPDAGSWVWQNFGLGPWESKDSQYHWAALMAVTVGKAPDGYRDDPKIAADLAALIAYLRGHYEAQPLLNKLVALWASNAFPAVMDAAERARLVDALHRLQHPDGGWSLTDLGPWVRVDKTPLETRSDGYATALSVLVLERTAADRRAEPHLSRGIAWLKANQDRATGAWIAWSINKNRDFSSDAGRFMSDAATGYAVLALEDHR